MWAAFLQGAESKNAWRGYSRAGGGNYCQIQRRSRVRNLAISWDGFGIVLVGWLGGWGAEWVEDQVPSILASYYFSLL